MAICEFRREDLNPIVKWSQRPGQVFCQAYSMIETESSVRLMKDNGAYIIAPATKKELLDSSGLPVLAYAIGYDPNSPRSMRQDDWNDDDFMINLPLAWFDTAENIRLRIEDFEIILLR